METEKEVIELESTSWSWECPLCQGWNNTSDMEVFWDDTTPRIQCDECKKWFLARWPN